MRRGLPIGWIKCACTGVWLGFTACGPVEQETVVTEICAIQQADRPELSPYSLGRLVARRGEEQIPATSTGFILINSRGARYIFGSYQPFGQRGILSANSRDLARITSVELCLPLGPLAASKEPILPRRVYVAKPGDTRGDYCCFGVFRISEDAVPLLLALKPPHLQEPLWIYVFEEEGKPRFFPGRVLSCSTKDLILQVEGLLPNAAIGSPCVNAKGEVVGIFVLQSNHEGQNLAHLVPWFSLHTMIEASQ